MKLKPRGSDGSAESRRRIETLITPRNGTWSMLPAAAVRDRALGPCSPLHILAWLCKFRNTKTGECFPSIERIARDLDITARTVQRHIEKLVKCGYLLVVPRLNSMGRQTSNSYYVLYDDLPATPDGDKPVQTPSDDGVGPKGPGELLIASDARVTRSVTPCLQEGTQEVALAQTRGDIPCRGGVTHDVGEGDTTRHPNYPTTAFPLDEPSAEAADARARARAATAHHEGDKDSDEGKAESTPAGNPQEAGHDMCINVPNMRPRPPAMTIKPLDALYQKLADKTRRHPGEVQVAMLGWLAGLEAAGLTALEAEQFVVDKGNLWIDAVEDNDPMADVDAEVRGRIVDLKLKVAC